MDSMQSKAPHSSRIPDPKPALPKPKKDDLSGYAHRQFIGWTSLALVPLILLFSAWRATQDLPAWPPLGSVSAYYYTGAVAVFVGILCALAALLFTYQGYDNDYHLLERGLALVAGLSAVVVALFPTGAPLDSLVPGWWADWIKVLHYGAAGILMVSSTVICLVLFRQTNQGPHPDRPKRIRNAIYAICGAGMVLALVWAAIALFTDQPIFGPEALSLVCFAVPWLVKGRVEMTPVAAARWTAHFVRHPQKIPVKMKEALAAKPRVAQSQS
jgi:multisubunit Na+/H+ antiporter MnhB subunit